VEGGNSEAKRERRRVRGVANSCQWPIATPPRRRRRRTHRMPRRLPVRATGPSPTLMSSMIKPEGRVFYAAVSGVTRARAKPVRNGMSSGSGAGGCHALR
jgi:hypothetical protein